MEGSGIKPISRYPGICRREKYPSEEATAIGTHYSGRKM
jgi:hypothetical protein